MTWNPKWDPAEIALPKPKETLPEHAQEFLSDLEALLKKHNVYILGTGFQFIENQGLRTLECSREHIGAYDLTYLTWKYY